MSEYLTPSWPAPKNIKAYCTTRLNGFSHSPYESFNLGDHVGDDSFCVQKNRNKLSKDLNLTNDCLWLNQVHKNTVIQAQNWQENIEADGCYSNEKNRICTIMTADCLPILLCDKNGQEVMALHGGWRSLAAGIITTGLQLFKAAPKDILVWLGPYIKQDRYEVGPEIRDQFLQLDRNFAQCFKRSLAQRWLLNLAKIAKIQFMQMGITRIYGNDHCSFSEKNLFFSYRRDKTTGRMASLIYCFDK